MHVVRMLLLLLLLLLLDLLRWPEQICNDRGLPCAAA